jgi:hypothetical protein
VRFAEIEILINPKFADSRLIEAYTRLIQEVEAHTVVGQYSIPFQYALDDVDAVGEGETT